MTAAAIAHRTPDRLQMDDPLGVDDHDIAEAPAAPI